MEAALELDGAMGMRFEEKNIFSQIQIVRLK